jgi:DNA-binding transcriptional MerR regulator
MEKQSGSSNEENRIFSVGEICERTGITRKTLFYYDRIGLLCPSERTERQNFKLYDSKKLVRLEQIVSYRRAGLSIREIRELLDDEQAKRLEILKGAMERLLMEKEDKEQEIKNLKSLIEAEADSAEE